MSKKQYEEIIKSAVNDSDICIEDIPSIDLYMDQIMTLIREKYASNKRFSDDKLLTKTMINNYSKEGLIKPVKGKKYSREHIVQMLMIYSMKNTLSIQEIKSVFEGIAKDEDFDETIIKCYEDFIEDKHQIRKMSEEMVISFMEDGKLNLEDDQNILVALLGITAMSSYMRNIAQRIVDEYYPVPTKKKEKK